MYIVNKVLIKQVKKSKKRLRETLKKEDKDQDVMFIYINSRDSPFIVRPDDDKSYQPLHNNLNNCYI